MAKITPPLNSNEYNDKYLNLGKYPFLILAQKYLTARSLSIYDIENTNIYDGILTEIFYEFVVMVFGFSDKSTIADFNRNNLDDIEYSVLKFYLTIIVLKIMDNNAFTKLWIKKYIEILDRNLSDDIKNNDDSNKLIIFFYKMLTFIDSNEYYKPEKINFQGLVGFGFKIDKYLELDVLVQKYGKERDELNHDYEMLKAVNSTFHRGYSLIPSNDFTTLKTIIKLVTKARLFNMCMWQDGEKEGNRPGFNLDDCKKLKHFIDVFVNKILQDANLSNYAIAKNFIGKQQAQERLELQNHMNNLETIEIIKLIIKEKKFYSIDHFPPCINHIINKLIVKKEKLRHAENMLLASYLGKKNFTFDDCLFIFKQAVNYNSKVTDYQLKALIVDRQIMPSSCTNLETESLCFKHEDNTGLCGKIKNPLVFYNRNKKTQ